MKNIGILILSIAFISFASCDETKKKEEVKETTEKEMVEEIKTEINSIEISLEAKNDSGVTGKLAFMKEGDRITLESKLFGLKPGLHAIHIHEKADCSATDGSSAGGHWNPTFEQHGKWGDDAGYHKGDIGNFEADQDGNGYVTMSTTEWCIGCGDEKRDILGKAIIVHQGADDFVSQPSGDAGSRVVCGAIIK
jgi:Cu-Zn family superoxide dismutase